MESSHLPRMQSNLLGHTTYLAKYPMATSLCLSDNRLGPRVSIDCRAFDFTLLFEDIFFTSLPAAVLLILLPIRLWFLRHEPVKITSYRLAVCKLVKVPPLYLPRLWLISSSALSPCYLFSRFCSRPFKSENRRFIPRLPC